MKVSEIMNREVFRISPQDRVSDVIDLFLEKKVTGVPVTEHDKVVGMISRKDILPLITTFDIDSSSLPCFVNSMVFPLRRKRGQPKNFSRSAI